MAEKFHNELKSLKKDALSMGNLARDMLRKSIDALIQQDVSMAQGVIAQKGEIHRMEVAIEERCYQLIALNQPMAKDMRIIVCTLKFITAAMRIGRYGKSIANIAKQIQEKPHIAHLMSIPHMAELVVDMVDDAIKAYDTDNIHYIEEFSARDDTIDALRHSIFREGITYMMEDPKNISRCTQYIMVARYLERCADHAQRIAENVHYMHNGKRIEIK